MVRPPCCDKLNVKRGLWTAEEDAKILAYVSKHGIGNWTALPKKAGLRRCGKSCRLRWTNYLRPDLKHDNFTPQEEELIVRLHAAIGSRWSIIAQQLPGRTDNDVKNYWNTKLRKKLSEMGIDPVTHKPFSQILADYGNIGCIPKYGGSRIGSLTRDLKNAFISKPEPSSPPEVNPNANSHLASGLMPPKVEPAEEYNSSFDLYDQLQAIKLVTEANNESSPSSSSSTCSTAAQEKSALNFNWRDFLLEDEFLPGDHNHHLHHHPDTNNVVNHSCKNDSTGQAQQEERNDEVINAREHQVGDGVDLAIPGTSFQVPSSYNTSFVEAMLNQENEIFLDFPDLLDEQFSY